MFQSYAYPLVYTDDDTFINTVGLVYYLMNSRGSPPGELDGFFVLLLGLTRLRLATTKWPIA